MIICLQCFDAVGWVAGRASGLYKTEWWGAGIVICLERGADLHMVQLMPLPLNVSCFSKILGFTLLVPAHWDKGPLNGCVCIWSLIGCSVNSQCYVPEQVEMDLSGDWLTEVSGKLN